MDALAREIGDKAHFLFIYTREAHPEHHPDEFPRHTSFAQKLEYARIMRQRHDTPRTILVDGLDGDVHRAYGGSSNMAWILDHTGRIHYKANWTREVHLRQELRAALEIRELKRNADQRVVAYYHEGMGYDASPTRSARTSDQFFGEAERAATPS